MPFTQDNATRTRRIFQAALLVWWASSPAWTTDLSERIAKIDHALRRFQADRGLSPEAAFWLPTLTLYRENVARGYKVKRLDEQYVPSEDYRMEQAGRAEELADALLKNDFLKLYRPGGVECALSSATDGTLSPYVLYLPESYASGRDKYPLIVYLHGANGTQWEVERSTTPFPRAEMARGNWIMAVPLGRGNSGYRGPAQKDLVQIVEELSRRLRIDPGRRAISGFSAGGIGAWRMALDYPEMFDAVIPICGILPWQVKDVPNLRKLVEATLPKDQIPKDLTELGDPERDPSCFDKLRGRHTVIIQSISDPVIPSDLVYAITRQLEARGVPFQLIKFDRLHTIYPGILEVYKSLYPR